MLSSYHCVDYALHDCLLEFAIWACAVDPCAVARHTHRLCPKTPRACTSTSVSVRARRHPQRCAKCVMPTGMRCSHVGPFDLQHLSVSFGTSARRTVFSDIGRPDLLRVLPSHRLSTAQLALMRYFTCALQLVAAVPMLHLKTARPAERRSGSRTR